MIERNRVGRRRALALSGSALSGVLAGCTSSGDSDTGASSSGDGRQPLEREDWADVDEIRLEGYTRGWYGVEPDLIAGIRNPAVLLVEGQEYDVTWENADGGTHNIAIRDADRSVITNTRNVRDRGATQSLSFEATDAMHEYVCEPHASSMIGYFKVVD